MQAAALLPSSMVRAPRLLVLANGVALAGATEAVVTSTGYFGADGFRVRAALGSGAADWAAAASVSVDVRMALSLADEFVSVVQGAADTVSLDPLRGTLSIAGRDASAALIETPTQEVFANRTSSEIATILAGRHGLAADVQQTVTPVGRYWELGHDRVTLNAGGRATTEWDLLVLLAQHEGFDLWVSDGALHFRTPDASPPVMLPVAALTSLRLERALTFAGDIEVTVKSWHSRAGAASVGVARTQRGGADVRQYVFVVPNLTQDAAEALARQRLDELSGHEMLIAAEMPGDLALRPRMLVRLTGTGTAFDTVFRIDEVERRLHAMHGFSQFVRARIASGGM